jgi:hypothetical protein
MDLPILPIEPGDQRILPVRMEILTPLERIEARRRREEARRNRGQAQKRPAEAVPQDWPAPVDYRV